MKNPDREYQGRLGAAIKAELGGRGWTQKQLAEASGVDYQSLQRYFRLERDMSVRQIAQIAEALGVTVDHLVAKAKEWGERGQIDPRHAAMVDDAAELNSKQKDQLKQDISTQTSDAAAGPSPVSSPGTEPRGRTRKAK